MAKQTYRINFKLRRRGQAALDSHRVEFKTEDYDSDEEFAEAIKAEALLMLEEDREYLLSQEGTDDED